MAYKMQRLYILTSGKFTMKIRIFHTGYMQTDGVWELPDLSFYVKESRPTK